MAESADPTKRQFSIIDLFILATVVSVCVATYQQFKALSFAPVPHGWRMASMVIGVSVHALPLFGLSLLVKRRMKGGQLYVHPGHLLTFHAGVVALFAMVTGLLLVQATKQFNLDPQLADPKLVMWMQDLSLWRFIVGNLLGLLLVIGLFRDRWWWRVFFAGALAVNLVDGTAMLCNVRGLEWLLTPDQLFAVYLINGYCKVLLAVWLVAILVCDFKLSVKRDWIHQIGWLSFLGIQYAERVFWMIAAQNLSLQEMTGQ